MHHLAALASQLPACSNAVEPAWCILCIAVATDAGDDTARESNNCYDSQAPLEGSSASADHPATHGAAANHVVSASAASADGDAERRRLWLPHVTAALLAPGESALRDRVSLHILPGLLGLDDGALPALLRALLPAPDVVATSEQVPNKCMAIGVCCGPWSVAC